MNNIITSIKRQFFFNSHLTQAVAVLWFISSILLSIGLLRNNIPVQIIGAISGTTYILILSWWLIQSKPHSENLQDCEPIINLFTNYRFLLYFIILLTLILVVLTSVLLQNGWLTLLLSIPISLAILIIWRKRLNRRFIIASLAIMIVLAFVEQLLGSEMSSGLIMPIGAALMFLAGALLLDHTRLTYIRLLNGEYFKAVKSFLIGCMLALPPALLNIISMRLVSPSEFDLLFDRWWEPLYALQPGIIEEIWARLLLITLLYALLRPTTNRQPQRAVFWALLIASFLHGMAHYPGSITNPLEGIYISLLYGIPLSLLFIKRDLEQAIAYHFFIDLVRFTAFVIWNIAENS
ncbi:MAG: hypothetical protein JEZ06_18840 [Anaerolineaceae bacterium]|nr:hypothetical protein [Anaerolineaceae bacterium]